MKLIAMKLTFTKFALICILLVPFSIWSQTVLYSEDFSGQVSKGVVGPSPYSYDTTGMTWTIDVSATTLTASDDYFKVNASETFEGTDLDGEAIWMSPVTTISSVASVDLSVDVTETGTLAGTEYIRIYYKLDGGSETLFTTNGDNTGDFTSAIASQDSLIGTTVQIVIRVRNIHGTRVHTFDNVSITENISNVQSLYELTDASSIDLKWGDPASAFDEILVVANQGSAITAGLPTGDGSSYTANSVLGSGTSLLGGTVVFKGSGTTCNFTGVSGPNTYYVKVFTRKGTSWSNGYESTVSYNPPGVGEVLITEYARHASISDYSYIELYNTTASDINLSGSKMIVNNAGSTSQIVDLRTDISGTIIVPANGFLILNRNRSQSNFESTWGVDLSNTGSTVNYNRTGINNFGNNKLFVLKLGGTEGTDDGTLIDETKLLTGATGKRVFQMPLGYWTGNLDNSADNATPGAFDENGDITEINLAYSDGSWHNATGYAHSQPSSSTGAAHALIVSGDATFDDGSVLDKLVINAKAGTSITTESITVTSEIRIAHNASLTITSSGSVTCSGDIIIEKEGFNAATDYNAWGSPYSTLLRMDSVFTSHNNCDFYGFEASNQAWKHDYTVGETINCAGFSYTVATGNIIPSPEGNPDGKFDPARGYFIVGNSSNKYSFKVSSGAMNNGSMSANIYGSNTAVLTGSNDWNLLSNPYPSGLSINSFLTTNSGTVSNAVYLYNPSSGMNTSTSYTTYNSTDGKHVASCQGFYVDANTTTDGLVGTVSFTNSMRSNTNDDFRSILSYFGVYLHVENANQVEDQTRVYFDSDAQEGIDSKFDAIKLENSGFNLSSKSGGKYLVFNGLPALTTTTTVVPLHFQTYETSTFTMSLDSLIGSFSDKDVLLEDRYMRKFYDLKYQSCQFSSIPKEWANRFYLHIVHKKEGSNYGNDITTGIDELEDDEVKVFVTSDEIVISVLGERNTLQQIEVIGLKGEVIITQISKGSTHRINSTTLSQGVYFVRVLTQDGQVITKRVMIQ
jgi:hypothetical protein